MFRSSPMSSFFLFASSSPTSTPSLSNFNAVTSRSRHNGSNETKSTLPHKLITIALAINTISLILCVCVIIVVIALTMTLDPSKSAFSYNHSFHNSGTTYVRQPNFIFTSVYPLISKVSFTAINVTSKSTTDTGESVQATTDAYKSNPLIDVKEKLPERNKNLVHHRRRGEVIPPPLLYPHLPILTTISPEIQALEQAYGQILAILPLFIISSLLGVSASAKSSTTGAIILYWIILTATLLISTYITSNFVEYENLFTLSTNSNLMKRLPSQVDGSDRSYIHSNSIIGDSVDDTIKDDDDFDDIYTDGESEKTTSNVSNSNSQVESVARIIVVIGALQMISAIILTLAKFHKTRVAIKDPSLNDLARFNNPINMTNIEHTPNIISSNSRRLSSRATIETSLQYYPDDNIDLINHSVNSSPSMSLHHYNHQSTSGRCGNLQNVTSFACNGLQNTTSSGNVVKTVFHQNHDDQRNCRERCDNVSSNNTRAGYFITQGSSEMNNFTNYSNCMYTNRVTLPEDILPIESVTCDLERTSNHPTVDNNVNVYNCNSSASSKLNDSVKISLPEAR